VLFWFPHFGLERISFAGHNLGGMRAMPCDEAYGFIKPDCDLC
jgi:hypothetical protein